MVKVIGISRRSGEYEGKLFDNTYVHTIRNAVITENESGQIAEIIKIKTELFNQCSVAINDNVTPIYNRYGQVTDFVIEKK